MSVIHGLRPVTYAITQCGRSLYPDKGDRYFNGAHTVIARKEDVLVTCHKCLARMRQGDLL